MSLKSLQELFIPSWR